jgi:glutathione S-transferase
VELQHYPAAPSANKLFKWRKQMKLYYDPCTVNCRKVLAGYDLLGVKYDTVKIDYFTAGQKSPEYLSINPNASLPALDDDGFVLWESNAMLQYGADKVGAEAYYPKDLKTRADINRWMLWESNAWFPSAYIYLVENVVKPLLKAEPDQKILDAQAENFHKLAAILDARLAKTPWLCGNSVTIADIAVAAPIHLHPFQKLPLDQHPNLKRWMTERVEKLPSWKKTDAAPFLGFPAMY